MPSRPITGVILAFWLAMTGWLIEREVVPMMLADAAPAYQIDLTEELEWTERNAGKRVGSVGDVRWSLELDGKPNQKAARSRVVANEDRTYEFRSAFLFDLGMLKIEALGFKVDVQEMESSYLVTPDGKLLAVWAVIGGNLGPRKAKRDQPSELEDPEFTFGIKGEIIDGQFEPIFFSSGFEHKLDKLDVSRQGSIVNSMHLVNRLNGLYDGRTWKIPKVDPFEGLKAKYGGLLGQITGPFDLIAKVRTDTLSWDRKEVACYKIEYHEADKDVSARTWVRRVDGLVLRQEATVLGKAMVLQRIP